MGGIAAIVIVILILVLGIIGYLVWNHRKNQTANIEPEIIIAIQYIILIQEKILKMEVYQLFMLMFQTCC